MLSTNCLTISEYWDTWQDILALTINKDFSITHILKLSTFTFILKQDLPRVQTFAEINDKQEFPGRRKGCEQISPYFSLSEVENFFKVALFWEKIVKISIFWGKNCKNFHFALFGEKVSPKSANFLFFPTPPC